MSFTTLITGTVITGVRLLNVLEFCLWMEEHHHIECEYCFGAEELTKDGKLFTPCPVCKGGTLSKKELVQANKKWLRDLKDELDGLKQDDDEHKHRP